MRGRWTNGVSFATAVAMALCRIGHTSAHSQLVMEQTFFMGTSTCDGASCRKEIVGANETLGVGAVSRCSHTTTYWPEDRDHAAALREGALFELRYSCRKELPTGEHVKVVSAEECGMAAEPCLDVGTDPEMSEVTYQLAFEFKTGADRAAYDVSVDVKLYMKYLKVSDDFYTLRSNYPPRCPLRETCHRRCEPGEFEFTAELGDSMGDGWNAGGINHFDYFRLESESELKAVVAADMTTSTSDLRNPTETAASSRRTSYRNTMLDGSSRKVPVCLSDGEYLFSTEFQVPAVDPNAKYGVYSAPAAAFSVGGRRFSESTWAFCGRTGMLSDHTYVRVSGGVCVAIKDWGAPAIPSATPVEGVTLAPTPAPSMAATSGESDLESFTPAPNAAASATDDLSSSSEDGNSNDGIGNADNTGGGDSNDDSGLGGGGQDQDQGQDGEGQNQGGAEEGRGGDSVGEGGEEGGEGTRDAPAGDASGDASLSTMAIWGIGLGAVGIAGLAAIGGTYAQNQGWFSPAGGSAAAAAAAVGPAGDGSAPNPDVDEFAP